MPINRSIVPNMITMANLVLGFFAIIFASKGNPESIAFAGVLIFIASFCDMFDGAAARALGVQSEIGGQLDSFADALSYGIAPGIISYKAYLYQLPEIAWGFDVGMLVASIFPAFAIYRLARFNLEEEEKGFTGLPSPAAGIIIASIPSLSYTKMLYGGIVNVDIPLSGFIIFYFIIGSLMVSKVDYSKLFADLYSKGKMVSILTIILITLLLVFFRMWAVFIVSLIYVFAGVIRYIAKKAISD